MFQHFYDKFSNDIGIDLGTANTLVYLEDKGIVIIEPSVVALNEKTGQIVAVGATAKEMLGRTPGHIRAIRPLSEGVISDFEITEEMLRYLINKADEMRKHFLRPRVVICIPSGVTSVEARAVYDAAKSAGAREVHIVEEPMAAAIGIRLPIHEPVGSMIIDIGGGTTDIAVISLGGIVVSKNLKIAGDKLDQDIRTYLRDEFKLLVGEKTAEDLKIAIGSVIKNAKPIEVAIRGRDLVTGLPREVIITDADVRVAIASSVMSLVDGVKEVLETTPPEILADIMHRGIVLVGGGALLKGFDKLLEEMVRIPVFVVDDPISAVARGTGVILADLNKYKDILLSSQDEFSSQS